MTTTMPEVVVTAAALPDDDLLLLVKKDGLVYGGWTSIRVTLRAEGCPNDFEFETTERYPAQRGSPAGIVIAPGDAVQVLFQRQVVVTGFVDAYAPSLGPQQHRVRVQGRGACQDLVDCSVVFAGAQISGTSVLGIAQKLAAPYNIQVTAIADVGLPIPQQNLNFGDKVYDVIEALARWHGLLAYEGPDGNLILANIGAAATLDSAIVEGQNVMLASGVFSAHMRYSEYDVLTASASSLQEVQALPMVHSVTKDPGVSRFRRLAIIAESGDADLKTADARGRWEGWRRYGRSYALHVTVDSWFTKAGNLWAPNSLVGISLPSMNIKDAHWVISEVTFRRSEQTGTVAELLLMPPEAFSVEPILLTPQPLRELGQGGIR